MILYTQGYDNLDVETNYDVGGTVVFGPDGVSGSVTTSVSNQPRPCGTPGSNCQAPMTASMPLIIIAVVVVVLLLRK
jgi:hypothetical protein